MMVSAVLLDIKKQYEKMYKKDAFWNNKPTMHFVEAMARSHDKHKSAFIREDLEHINSLMTIQTELEKEME